MQRFDPSSLSPFSAPLIGRGVYAPEPRAICQPSATPISSDTAACMENCLKPNRLQWLAMYPQGHYSSAQGFVGQRTAYFQGSQAQLRDALRGISSTSWPEPMNWCQDCLPIDIQYGAAGGERETNVFGNIADDDIGQKLEGYNLYRIAVIYQLLHISDWWPITGKPAHPRILSVGNIPSPTTLTLQVRGGGEILLIDPLGVNDGIGLQQAGCFMGKQPATGIQDSASSRMRIPLTEYHLCCDRITDDQLCGIMNIMPWKCREQTVNCGLFLNEDPGTLLFDSWTLDQTFVPDVDMPRRWRLSCVLKCRQVPGMKGPSPDDCTGKSVAIGWNHDYKRAIPNGDMNLGWRFIMMSAKNNWTAAAAYTPYGSCPEPWVPRFPYTDFSDMFCNQAGDCCPEQTPNCILPDCTATTPGIACPDNGSVDASRMAGSQIARPRNEAMEQQVAEIMAESRLAHARRVMASQERQAAGSIEVEKWPPGTPPPLRDIMLEQDRKTAEMVAEIRKSR